LTINKVCANRLTERYAVRANAKLDWFGAALTGVLTEYLGRELLTVSCGMLQFVSADAPSAMPRGLLAADGLASIHHRLSS
jgi:hypothetical protein